MKGDKMKIAKYWDNYYGDVRDWEFVRNYAYPGHVESIWKNKITGKAVSIDWKSKSSFNVEK